MLVEGYHPGVEDDGVYLAAIQRRLHPALYPHDFSLFTRQMQASIFDRLMAGLVRMTHLPLPVIELAGQYLAAFFLLWGCRALAERCFPTRAGVWAAMGMVGVLFTLPVAGTALYLFDQALHPRALATVLILAAILQVLNRRLIGGAVLLVLALVMHPLMGAFGISYCIILLVCDVWSRGQRSRAAVPARAISAAAFAGVVPSWIFERPSPAWRAALDTRNYYFLSRWAWYEWLGALAPMLILWLMARHARRANRPTMARLASSTAIFAAFQLAVACIILFTPRLVRLTPMQPMRYLHLVYLIMILLGGGLIGEKLLRNRPWRWFALFLPLAAGMFLGQRALFPESHHLELPGRSPRNSWVQAFVWVRHNTPEDAYFALDPHYMARPGEDQHSFRALAERSELADAVKDAAVATQVPDLASLWLRQTQAAAGWQHFGRQDFLRLRQQFGVNWIIVSSPSVDGLACPYRNQAVSVCRL